MALWKYCIFQETPSVRLSIVADDERNASTTGSLDDDSQSDHSLHRDGSSTSQQESLIEWRAIRMEQDKAYEESLQADKRKVSRVECQY